MQELISDDQLKYLILGMFRAVPMMEAFPLKMRRVDDNFDEDGQIESFTIVTESGLRYTTTVTFDGEES
jgi:hypothetical protein